MRTPLNAAAMTCACAIITSTPALAEPECAAMIVDRVRDSLGIANFKSLGIVRLAGTAQFLGNDCAAEVLLDAEGRSRLAIAGPISATWGNDGQTAWTTDFPGETRRETLGDREQVVIGSLIFSGLAFAEGADVQFTRDDERSAGSAAVLTFAHDDARMTGEIEVDRATWRPVKWTVTSGPTTQTWELSGDIEAGGVHFPSTITQSTDHGMRTTYTFAAAEKAPAADASRFAMPAHEYTDVRFDAAAPTALEIKKAPTGHLLVKATLDGEHEGWFIFDTGAGMNCLASTAIEAHQYQTIAEIPAMGVGGSVGAPMVRPKSLKVGPVTLEGPLCVGLDLAAISGYMGEDIKGIIGYSLFARSVAEIDMTAPSVNLFEPRAYTLKKGEWSELTLTQRVPGLSGSIEGHKGVFKVDTGAANSTLAVHAPAVERLKLLEGRETKPTQMGGVGGFVQARSGVITSLELAGTQHENLTVNFATERKGAFADPHSLGNVGGKLLANFTLVVDYQNNRAALVPKE